MNRLLCTAKLFNVSPKIHIASSMACFTRCKKTLLPHTQTRPATKWTANFNTDGKPKEITWKMSQNYFAIIITFISCCYFYFSFVWFPVIFWAGFDLPILYLYSHFDFIFFILERIWTVKYGSFMGTHIQVQFLWKSCHYKLLYNLYFNKLTQFTRISLVVQFYIIQFQWNYQTN